MKSPRLVIVAVGAGLVLAACMVERPVPSGLAIFQSECAGCHGASGQGDGPFAANLSQTPPDLTLLSQRNGGTFPRDEVLSIIDGFDRGSHFAPEMPVFGDRDLGPTTIVEDEDGIGTPIPERLLAVSEYLQSIQQ